MALQKIVDSMRDVTVVDAAKITTGAVPAAALTNVDLVEGTKGTDIASAGTMVIGTDGGYFDITGTTGITAMTVAAGRAFTLQFDGAVVLTNSSTLKLSGATNFTTAAGDHMTFISVAANDVRQVGFGLTDGGSPVAAGRGWEYISKVTASGAATIAFTNMVAGYDYLYEMDTITCNTDAQGFYAQLGVAGPTYRTSNTTYRTANTNIDNPAVVNSRSDTNKVDIFDLSEIKFGTASNEALHHGSLFVNDPAGTTNKTSMSFTGHLHGDNDESQYMMAVGVYETAAEAHVAIQLVATSGTLTGVVRQFRKVRN